ncbi:hypothetical protein CsSME_00006109 [Camellia sinensis var. sinensis]
MVALALSSSLHASNSSIYGSIKLNPCCPTPSLLTATKISQNTTRKNSSRSRRLTVFAVTEGSSKEKEEESIPSWARPDSDEPPPWARDEASQSASQQSFQIPFFVYLLASAITAIAAIGSVFEYLNQKPVFGVLSSDSVFYAPLLGFFAFTGIPTSVFCGSNPFKLLTRRLRNKTGGMVFCRVKFAAWAIGHNH